MLNSKETYIVLAKFFGDCLEYWKKQDGFNYRKAFEHALDDVKNVKRDPFMPCGQELDEGAKAKFIKYREMDLGR